MEEWRRLVPARIARWDRVLDEVSAAIPRDAVARNIQGQLHKKRA